MNDESVEQRIESLRRSKTPLTRADVVYMLDTMAAVKLSVDSLTAAVTDGMNKIIDAAGVSAADNPHPAAPLDGETAARADGEPNEYTCFNCGDINDKPLAECRKCHAGLKWK